MGNKINNIPPPPAGLQERGRQLWESTLREFELGGHEMVILTEACRTAEIIDDLQAQIEEDGVLLSWGGGWRNHPALAEVRQQRIVLARLVAALQIPADDSEDQQKRRPRDRFGPRGFYGMAPKPGKREEPGQ